MSSSYTQTYSYTVIDVRTVMDQVRADLRMAAQSSGALSLAEADDIMADVTLYAEKGYLARLLIRLVDAAESTVKAATYEVTTDAKTLTASRSANMMWPEVAGGSLKVLITPNDVFKGLSSTQQANFRGGLRLPWPLQSAPSLAHLSAANDRNYVSNAYAAKKKVYE
jgi:hypothetical protein